MKRIGIVLLLLALGACMSATAPKSDGGCPPGYMMSSGRQCVPG